MPRYIVWRDFTPNHFKIIRYWVYVPTSELERSEWPTALWPTDLSNGAEVYHLADLAPNNVKVMYRRIAELAFPEVAQIEATWPNGQSRRWPYPNKLPARWLFPPEEHRSSAYREVILDEIPPEWFEQDPEAVDPS